MKSTHVIDAETTTDPEIIIPDDLAPYYDAAHAAASRTQGNPSESPFWPMDVRRQATYVVAQRYDVTPGSVNRPPSLNTFGQDDAELAEWHAAYAASQNAEREYGEHFRSEVDELADSILSDRFRSLRLFIHFAAIESAKTAKQHADRAEQSRMDYLRKHTCPMCGECDPATNGSIQDRKLLTGNPSNRLSAQPSIKSCFACWEEAHAQYIAKLATKSIDDLGRTRRQAIANHMNHQN